MAFFGLLKSKQEKELDESMQRIQETIFPNGESDKVRDCNRVARLINGKLMGDDLTSFVAGNKALMLMSSQDSDDYFVDAFVRRSRGVLTPDEAYEVYVYLAGEAMMKDRFSLNVKSSGGTISPQLSKQFEEMGTVFSKGTYTDTVLGGFGEYGLVVTNPIPTISIDCSKRYLAKLRRGGRSLEHNRRASTTTPAILGGIDIYDLSVGGTTVGSIFVSPYQKRNSKRAPNGFTFE